MFYYGTLESGSHAVLYQRARKARAVYLANLLRSMAHRVGDLFSQAAHRSAATHG